MMDIANSRERKQALSITLGIAIVLSLCFLPAVAYLSQTLAQLQKTFAAQWIELFAFPTLAGLLYLTIPKTHYPPQNALTLKELILLSLLPVGIAYLFGVLHPAPPIWSDFIQSKTLLPTALWILLFAPIGEELIFRGWLYHAIEHKWPNKHLTVTNPLPLSVGMTSLAFSLWHGQNLNWDPTLTLFQVPYTFFTGIWLGYLRWHSGSIALCLFFHIAINAAANIG